MQIMSGLRYLDRPLTYGTTHSAAGGATVVGSSGSGGSCCSGAGGSDGRYYEDDGDVHGGRGGGGGSGGHKANKKLTIIHYDLKPANILFDELGDVKITGKLGCLVTRWIKFKCCTEPFAVPQCVHRLLRICVHFLDV